MMTFLLLMLAYLALWVGINAYGAWVAKRNKYYE